MLFRFYFIIIICLSGLPLLGKVQPLSHEEIVGFRATQSAAIGDEKLICGTVYDAVAILSLANKWKDPLARPDTNPEYTDQFLSRLVQGVCLGYGFKNGVQSSLKPSATDRVIFQTSLENAGAQLLVTSDLPTGAAVWSDTGESHNAHAVQMAEWLKVGRAGGDLDMEYPAAAGTLVVLPDASWGVMHENAVRSDDLVIHDWRGFGVKRLTNVPIRQGFYDNEFFQVTNCHPYNPTDVLKGAAKTMEQPIVIEYDYDAYKEDVPESIKKIAEGCATRLYLNVQDNPWNGNQILLRPHAMRWMFPSDNNNYGAVRAYGVDDAGQEIVNETSSVYPHSTRDLLQRTFIQASPPNVMVLKNVDPKKEMAFYSAVVYGGKAAITRHIFLTPEQREQLQLVFVPDAKAYKADEFQEFLTPGWRDFLVRMGIPPSLE